MGMGNELDSMAINKGINDKDSTLSGNIRQFYQFDINNHSELDVWYGFQYRMEQKFF